MEKSVVELDKMISGHFMVAEGVEPYYTDTRIGTRVLNRMMFLACVVGHLRDMFKKNPTETEGFLRDGTFLLKYPSQFRNYVSPQCAPRSQNPDDYVTRQGPDGICRAYLKRNRQEAEQVWVGGMTRERYFSERSDELKQEDLDAIEEAYPSTSPLIVITYVYGDMLYPIEQLPGESLLLPPTLERALRVIQECGEGQDPASLPDHMKWVEGYINFSLDHNKRFAWVAD